MHLKQEDRDRLIFFERKINLSVEEKHEITNLKNRRRQINKKAQQLFLFFIFFFLNILSSLI